MAVTHPRPWNLHQLKENRSMSTRTNHRRPVKSPTCTRCNAPLLFWGDGRPVCINCTPIVTRGSQGIPYAREVKADRRAYIIRPA